MASTAPWTVKTSKRKSAANTPHLHERRWASPSAEDQVDVRARRVRQQTLTQIQWAPSRPVSFDEADLRPLEIKSEPRRRRVPGSKKQYSTLTQMDALLRRPSIGMIEQDLAPLLLPVDESATVPQLDGHHDSPRKPRPSKTSGAQAIPCGKRKSTSTPVGESQEYMPTRKRRKGNAEADETSVHGQRRRSGRHAEKIPSDPAENFAVFQEALANVMPTVSRPTLEIKDSTGLDEDVENLTQSQQNRRSSKAIPAPALEVQDSIVDEIEVVPQLPAIAGPKTPQAKRYYIPSSQSPESLPPSTKRKDRGNRSIHKDTPKRNPLAERSTNTPTRRPVADVDGSPRMNSTSKRKICTLKLPRVPPGWMKKCVEDSQADIWAVQPTSSPKQKGNSQRLAKDLLPIVEDQEDQREIPSTSQIQNDTTVSSSPPQAKRAETLESLESLNAIFGRKGESPTRSNDTTSKHASEKLKTKTRDFVTHPQRTPQKETQYVRFLQTPPGHIDEDDDLGSPVANDTQFVAAIARIPTSAMGTSDPLEALSPHYTIRISSSSSSEGDAPTSPLPSPKLVDRVEYQKSTTKMPTKDLSSPTLLPILPPMPMPPPAQRLIAPASLPHPSQMSTQEPSQQLLQLSSVPQWSPTVTQRITIKDSSSIHEHLSQLPEYDEDELQLQRELERTQHNEVLQDEDEENEDDDEDAYDDLDPKTPRKTIRSEQAQQSELFAEHVEGLAPSPSRPEEEDNFPDPSPPANFTQNGHVTAARIEDMRRRGLIPPGYNPPAYKVPSARELLPAWMFEDDDDEI